VISIHDKTKPELFSKLLKHTTITGRPSFYLQELNETALKIRVGQDLIKHQFLQALPTSISVVLASQTTLSLNQLGTLADELVNYNQGEVTLQVSNSQPQQTCQRNNSSVSPTRLSLCPFSPDQLPKVCRAHLYFAEKARTCKSWCHWPDKQDCTIQTNSRASSPRQAKNVGN
jgi:hypothetical protein